MMKSKGFMFLHHQQQQQQQSHLLQQQQYSSISGVEETMSNLTSAASGEASVSNSETGAPINYQYYAPPPPDPTLPQPPPFKKKRSLPGNPDPDAEVIALSPKTLMATNRFMCEICGKGFQRDQNLQLHRRGHNLPWKLKQRASKDVVRKKVYVCPEPGCVHHEPTRALGDLTGIKKHFCRKHGEKKWKCDKCSKRYAVQSDWKAHSKICGTREYRCDCGTLFSRRDSFITHRAFCDALAEESTRANSLNNILSTSSSSAHHLINSLPPHHQFVNTAQNLHQFTTPKKEEQVISSSNNSFGLIRQDHHMIPPWLASNSCPPPPPQPPIHDHLSSSSLVFPNTRLGQEHHQFPQSYDQNPSPSPSPTAPFVPPYHSTATALLGTQQPNMSATALLQKAAQMGATMGKSHGFPSPLISSGGGIHQIKHQQEEGPHLYAVTASATASSDHLGKTNDNGNNNGGGSGNFELSLSSHDEEMRISVSGYHRQIQQQAGLAPFVTNHSDNLVGFEGADNSSFEDAFGGILSGSSKKDENDDDIAGDGNMNNPGHVNLNSSTAGSHIGRRQEGGGGDRGLTRDFLGLRPLSQSDILSIAGFGGVGSCMSTSSSCSSHDQVPRKRPWQG